MVEEIVRYLDLQINNPIDSRPFTPQEEAEADNFDAFAASNSYSDDEEEEESSDQ